jgi:hypothetical protein
MRTFGGFVGVVAFTALCAYAGHSSGLHFGGVFFGAVGAVVAILFVWMPPDPPSDRSIKS